MKVLVTGASGFLGHHISQALSSRGDLVIAASRASGFDFARLLTESDWLPHLDRVDAVVNCVGIIAQTRRQRFETLHHLAPAALFRACATAGVARIVQISALGVDQANSCPYQASKKRADEAIAGFPGKWYILRPSLVYGPGGASHRMFQRLCRLPVLPLVSAGRQQIQPVHVNDVSACVLKCLSSEQSGLTLNVVGPKPYSFAEWLQLLRRKQGRKPAVILPLPLGGILAFAQLARYVVPMLHPDNLYMLEQGNTADVSSVTEFLGRPTLAAEDML